MNNSQIHNFPSTSRKNKIDSPFPTISNEASSMAQLSSNDSSSSRPRPSIASRRLLTELDLLNQSPIPNCHAHPSSDSILLWFIVIDGPKDTVYEGGTFFIELNFGDNYPYDPPEVQFMTRIYHCNINTQGEICLGLNQTWKSSMGIRTILERITSLFYTCDPYNPLMPTIAEQYLKQPEKYKQMAKIWTQRYAS